MTALDARITVSRPTGWMLDIHLSIDAGETAALLGPNGAGKSTTIEVLAGLTRIDTGYIRLGGRTLDDPASGTFVEPEARGVGVVFQDRLLFPHLSVADNVAFGPRSRGGDPAGAALWMERLDLDGLAHRRPSELSGGQAQRVALARCLASEPQMILLDEPLAALDVAATSSLRGTLAEHLGGFEGPRLLITHEPREAFLLAHTVHILEEGRILQSGTADEIRLRPKSAFAADLAGVNLLRGVAAGHDIDIGGHILRGAGPVTPGPVLATIHPRAISLFPVRPEGSPRNTWQTTITSVEPFDDRVRVALGFPVPLVAEITREAQSTLGIAPGASMWVAVKATEIGLDSA